MTIDPLFSAAPCLITQPSACPLLPADGEERRPAPALRGRILHVINGEHYSGAERVQDLLGLGLRSWGYEVGFACVKPDRFPRERRSRECPLFITPMKSRGSLSAARALARIVKREGFHALHAHTPRTALLGALAARQCDVPLVYHVHSPVGRDSTRRFRNFVNQCVERWSLRNCRHVVTVSESLMAYMQTRGVPRSRITVVPNGVPRATICRSERRPHGSWVLGMVALFRPRKGLEILLQSLAQLRSQGKDVRLRAVGPFETPAYGAEIHNLVTTLRLEDAIDWIGYTSDVTRELSRMDLFVLPSLFGEGLPMVILEAMTAGVPVVCSRVEGVPEAIRDGIDGLLAQPNDPVDLTRVMERIISGQVNWNSLQSSARQRHADHFSDMAMAEGVAKVYDQFQPAVE